MIFLPLYLPIDKLLQKDKRIQLLQTYDRVTIRGKGSLLHLAIAVNPLKVWIDSYLYIHSCSIYSYHILYKINLDLEIVKDT